MIQGWIGEIHKRVSITQLSSWKLDFKSGGRTQTVIDSNGFAIMHSKTLFLAKSMWMEVH